MDKLHKETENITALILEAVQKARSETGAEPEPALTHSIKWPVECLVGPGLEGAIACESNIGYVNGSKGWLIYRGYDIFELCAHSSFEEVSYLLLYGNLPTHRQLRKFKKSLTLCRNVGQTLRLLVNFPIRKMGTMEALRLGSSLMRHEFLGIDRPDYDIDISSIIGTDEDSIPMETKPKGESRAIYEFKQRMKAMGLEGVDDSGSAVGLTASYHLIAGLATIAAAIARIRQGHFPIEPDPDLNHAANLIYMMTGRVPTPLQERLMDIVLILHADHGMNASTFASMVVASTLSDMYLSVSSGIAALNGPLHGGANEQVLRMLKEIGSVNNVKPWFKAARNKKRKIPGFGHRVYKAYDPRARVLCPLAEFVARENKAAWLLFRIAQALEKEVVSTLGVEKKIFPNVDFYSGIVYYALGIPPELFTPMFAVSRVAGWTARVMEYLKHNRIFRPRAMYVGPFDKKYVPLDKRKG
jgi:citrate synthase